MNLKKCLKEYATDSNLKGVSTTRLPNLTPRASAVSLAELCKEAYEISASKGWHAKKHDPTVRLMLMVTEIAEVVEELRKGYDPDYVYYVGEKPEGPAIEIADVFIRLGDYCAEYNIDIEAAIREKLAYNRTRPLMHGGRKF